ncbi:MAG: hypothetical protein ABSA47_02755 [Verrucomicrobiota bacterium]
MQKQLANLRFGGLMLTMSNEVAAAIITAAGALVGTLIGLVAHRRKRQGERQEGGQVKVASPALESKASSAPVQVKVGPGAGAVEVNVGSSMAETKVACPAAVLSAAQGRTQRASGGSLVLTHEQIAAVIKAVPPLQQDGIAASYKGVRVVWRGKLSAATRTGDRVLILVSDILKKGLIFACRAAPEDCVGLLVAPEGTDVIVHGNIEEVGEWSAKLSDCTFDILEE